MVSNKEVGKLLGLSFPRNSLLALNVELRRATELKSLCTFIFRTAEQALKVSCKKY